MTLEELKKALTRQERVLLAREILTDCGYVFDLWSESDARQIIDNEIEDDPDLENIEISTEEALSLVEKMVNGAGGVYTSYGNEILTQIVQQHIEDLN